MENQEFVTVFYRHSTYEGYYMEGKHAVMANCYKKGIIVLPGNDEDAYYDTTSTDVDPMYWFAGSGDYPDPLDFTYYNNALEPSAMPEKLIQLLIKRNTILY